MKIARVITTWDCHRDCDLCCNKNLPVEPRPCTLADLADYDQVLLTGGEPMLYPERLFEIIHGIRKWDLEQEIYLYTVMYKPSLEGLVPLLDGIQYSLHHPVTPMEILNFTDFQFLIGKYRDTEKTFRLYVDNRITEPVLIEPHNWLRVGFTPWREPCPLPEGEELFVLEGAT